MSKIWKKVTLPDREGLVAFRDFEGAPMLQWKDNEEDSPVDVSLSAFESEYDLDVFAWSVCYATGNALWYVKAAIRG